MLGKVHLVVKTKKVEYSLVLNRKISVIKGKSGTGKSSLVSLVIRLLETPLGGGVSSNYKERLVVLRESSDWESILKSNKDKIIISDEGLSYLPSDAFSCSVKNSDNYFIFISRSGILGNLPYSIKDVYELETNKVGDMFLTRSFSRYFNDINYVTPDVIITEDSKSGYFVFKSMAELLPYKCRVVSSGGNSKIYEAVKSCAKIECVYVIVDGAAFGSYMSRLELLWQLGYNFYLFAPESFEYLVLATKFYKKFLSGELENTEEYCDITRYFSWENYFEDLLDDLSINRYNFSYKKGKYPKFFRTDIFKEEFKKQLPELFR